MSEEARVALPTRLTWQTLLFQHVTKREGVSRKEAERNFAAGNNPVQNKPVLMLDLPALCLYYITVK